MGGRGGVPERRVTVGTTGVPVAAGAKRAAFGHSGLVAPLTVDDLTGTKPGPQTARRSLGGNLAFRRQVLQRGWLQPLVIEDRGPQGVGCQT